MGIWACESPDDLDIDLGFENYPTREDTLTELLIKTEKSDSVRTDNLNFHTLGYINDSVFGETKASVFTQVYLPGALEIPQNAEVDSIYLQLRVVNLYGNSTYPQDFSVYLLKDSLIATTDYYNTSKVAKGEKIGELKNFTLDGSSLIKIDITKLWGKAGIEPGAVFNGVNAFQKSLKGLVIEPTTNKNDFEGAIYYFNPVDLGSNLSVYFHYFEQANGVLDRVETSTRFLFNESVEIFSKVNRKDQDAPVSDYYSADSTEAQLAFLQSLGGSDIRIKIPQLKNMADSPYLALHKVELYLPCELELHNPTFTPIEFLDLKVEDENGQTFDLPDKNKVYWTRSYNQQRQGFVFNITSYAQNTITAYKRDPDFEDPGVLLRAIKNEPIPFSAGRYVLKGPASKRKDGSYLSILYSEIGSQ